jgi:hypothetical protein
MASRGIGGRNSISSAPVQTSSTFGSISRTASKTSDEFYCKRSLFPHHQVARILLRPSPLHWRRRARVVRCDVRGHHLERISALLQARINGDGLSPARVQLSHQNEQHGFHTITSIALTSCSRAFGRFLAPAIGLVLREPVSSLPQFLTYAAAIRCQASYEMEETPVSDKPIDCYCRVAYTLLARRTQRNDLRAMLVGSSIRGNATAAKPRGLSQVEKRYVIRRSSDLVPSLCF